MITISFSNNEMENVTLKIVSLLPGTIVAYGNMTTKWTDVTSEYKIYFCSNSNFMTFGQFDFNVVSITRVLYEFSTLSIVHILPFAMRIGSI